MDILQQIFTWDAVPGHVAYAIIAVSYLLTSIFWLRVAAVVGIAFEICYFLLSGSLVRTSIVWDSAFILNQPGPWSGGSLRDRLSSTSPPTSAPSWRRSSGSSTRRRSPSSCARRNGASWPPAPC